MRGFVRNFAVVAVLVVAAGCASSGAGAPMAVEMTHPAGPGTVTLDFTATGAAVDDGAVCPAGSERIVALEDTAGEPMTDAEWGEQFDAAMAEGSVAELVSRSEWVCDDGSGTFTLELRNRFDFDTETVTYAGEVTAP